ncbi:hypothetical protein E4U26_005546 [Claviceps purpurea]|nr:hypothetical protein E4U11_005103 [Claviceps purpurea]KAG6232245.1 hypothetical protein E4U26_005546 [Claviceps purpurea]
MRGRFPDFAPLRREAGSLQPPADTRHHQRQDILYLVFVTHPPSRFVSQSTTDSSEMPWQASCHLCTGRKPTCVHTAREAFRAPFCLPQPAADVNRKDPPPGKVEPRATWVDRRRR